MTSLRADHGEPARVSAHSAIKLRVPTLPACNVRRPRLLDQLDAAGPEGVPERVVVVHGPAGSGKTSLVADWAGTVAKPVSWFTLDERDRVASECWTNLVAAIDRLRPGCLDDAHRTAGRRTFPPTSSPTSSSWRSIGAREIRRRSCWTTSTSSPISPS